MFFWFKQKTAYEMRISDWSSDVCSSDLAQVEWKRLQLRCACKRNFTITEGSAGIMKFHIIELADEPEGYVNVSTSAEWESWIRHCLPDGLDQEVRRRLVSTLKHVTVGLELKADRKSTRLNSSH